MKCSKISVLASDGKMTKKIAWMNLSKNASGKKMIICGVVIKRPKELDFEQHITYHEDGECHLKTKLYGEPKTAFKCKLQPFDNLKGSIPLFSMDFVLQDLNRYPGKHFRKKEEMNLVTINTSHSESSVFPVKMCVVQPGTEPVVKRGEKLHLFKDAEPWRAVVVSR